MTVKSIDTSEGHEITVGGADMSDGQGVTLVDTTNTSGCWLSLAPAEARAIAAALLEYADIADLANLEAEAGDNPYEQAAARFNHASEAYPRAARESARILQAANDAYDAAQDDLRKYEARPGIPLPEYRASGWNLANPALSIRLDG